MFVDEMNCKNNENQSSTNFFNFNAFASLSITNNIIQKNEKPRIHRKKNPFSIEEDEYLKYLVNLLGQNWDLISENMQKSHFNKNIRQCRDRYYHYLDPNISTDICWSQSEDECLLNLVEKVGKKWKIMEKMFPGRTEVSLRNRYNLLLRKFNREQKKINQSQNLKSICSFLNSADKKKNKSKNKIGNDASNNCNKSRESTSEEENKFDFIDLTFDEANFEDLFTIFN